MTAAFVTGAALLALLTLGFVVRPLWRGHRVAALGMAVAIAVIAGSLYLLVGTPQALDPAQRKTPDNLTGAIAQLESELRRNPEQPEGWRLLARAYASQGRAQDARDAFAQAVKFAPDDADLLVGAAESRALADGNRHFDEDAVALLRRALAQQPMHQRARWFLGIAQRQVGQPAEAAKTWEPLLSIVDTDTAAPLRAQIDAARAEAGLPPLAAGAGAPDATGDKQQVELVVELAPGLRDELREGDVLFVMARQRGGPPMPVAARRLPATGFPVKVALGDADSPMPTLKLSQVREVELIARVSRKGSAERASGDLESEAVPAQVGTDRTYTVRIGQQVE